MTNAPSETQEVRLPQTRLGQMLGKQLPEIPDKIPAPDLTGLDEKSSEYESATQIYKAACKARAQFIQKRNLILQFELPLALIAKHTGLPITNPTAPESSLGAFLGAAEPSEVTEADTIVELQNALAYLNLVQTATSTALGGTVDINSEYNEPAFAYLCRFSVVRSRQYAEMFGGNIGALRNTLEDVVGPMLGIDSFAIPQPVVHKQGELGVVALKRRQVVNFAINVGWSTALCAVQNAASQTRADNVNVAAQL